LQGVFGISSRDWQEASDAELLELCRGGETEAFAVVWERHRHAAKAAARGIAPTLDPDDIVSDAYLKIFELTLQGGGPRGAFRPYLYRVIRSAAIDRLRSPEIPSDELDQIPDLHELGPWEDGAFDLNAVSRAFETLNDRWQAALWYTEVEGMPPREVALLLGMSANSVSALAVRAREALRSSWVEAHVTQQLADADCEWTRQHLQRYQRGKLTARATREVEAHLDACDECSAIAAEFLSLNSQLGLVLAAIFLGSAGAIGLFRELGLGLGLFGTGTAAAASTGYAVGVGGTSGAGSTGGTAAGPGTVALVSTGIAVAAATVLGGAALVIPGVVSGSTGSESSATSGFALPPIDVSSLAPPVDFEADSDPERADETVAPAPERDVAAPAPRSSPPAPTPPPPSPPKPPGDDGDDDSDDDAGDPAPAVTNTCRTASPPELFWLEGDAPGFGIVEARLTHGSDTVVLSQNFTTFTPPATPGGAWHWESKHPESPTEVSLTPLSNWGLPDSSINSVTVELRFVAWTGDTSSWVPIDTSVDC